MANTTIYPLTKEDKAEIVRLLTGIKANVRYYAPGRSVRVIVKNEADYAEAKDRLATAGFRNTFHQIDDFNMTGAACIPFRESWSVKTADELLAALEYAA